MWDHTIRVLNGIESTYPVSFLLYHIYFNIMIRVLQFLFLKDNLVHSLHCLSYKTLNILHKWNDYIIKEIIVLLNFRYYMVKYSNVLNRKTKITKKTLNKASLMLKRVCKDKTIGIISLKTTNVFIVLLLLMENYYNIINKLLNHSLLLFNYKTIKCFIIKTFNNVYY